MNRRIRYIFHIFLYLAVVSGCGETPAHSSASGPENLSEAYFSGRISWSGDGLYLTDRNTGAPIRLSSIDNFFDRDDRLLAGAPGQDSVLFIEVTGKFDREETPTGTAYSLEVDSLLSLRLETTLPEQETVAGFYTASTAKARVDLLLNGSYRFTLTVHILDGEEKHDLYTGQWRMTAPDRIRLTEVLKNGEPFSRMPFLFFDPETGTITHQIGRTRLYFRKTYL